MGSRVALWMRLAGLLSLLLPAFPAAAQNGGLPPLGIGGMVAPPSVTAPPAMMGGTMPGFGSMPMAAPTNQPSPAAPQDEQDIAVRTLVFSHVVTPDDPKGMMARKFKELVEQRLAGKVRVEVYPNSEYSSDEMVLHRLLLGDVHFALPSVSLMGKYTNKFQVFELPFLFNDQTAVARFENSPAGRALLTSMEDKGLIGLGYMHHGMKQFTATEALRRPQNAKGLTIRVQRSRVLEQQITAMGAIAEVTPFKEVADLLRAGAIEGQENTWSNILSQGYYKYQPYITETRHAPNDYILVVSKAFWRGLSKGIRKELAAIADEALAYGNQIAEARSVQARAEIIAAGTSEIIELTAEDRQAWIDAMRPVWAGFEGEIGRDVVDAAKAANENQSAAHD